MGRNDERNQIKAALESARARERDRFLSLMEHINLNAATPSDANWLQAERAYRNNRYSEALKLFAQFDRDEHSGLAPIWQRYLSAHHQAFSFLQLGMVLQAEEQLNRAEALLRASTNDERKYIADITAMRAHFLEQRSDFEGALVLFERAHTEASANDNRDRAITAASDIARVLGILGRAREGLTWIERAQELSSSGKNALVERTLRLRKGMFLAMLGLNTEAEQCFTSILEEAADGTTPGVALNALARRADIRRTQRNYAAAERDLLDTIALGERSGLKRHAAHALCDLASLRLERDGPGDRAMAVLDFRNSLANLPSPAPPVSLMQFAETVLVMPGLVNRDRLPADRRNDIQETIEALRDSLRPSFYQRSTRKAKAESLANRLSLLLEALVGRIVALRTHVVDFGTRKVAPKDGHSKKSQSVGAAELELLDYLLKQSSGQKPIEIADGMNITLPSALKRISRLGVLIGPDLVKERKGNERFYAVWWHAHSDSNS